jgi:Mg-chelatase subunit ChlI
MSHEPVEAKEVKEVKETSIHHVFPFTAIVGQSELKLALAVVRD